MINIVSIRDKLFANKALIIKRGLLLTAVSILSLIVSLLIFLFIAELIFRTQSKGIKSAVLSFFTKEPPYSSLGTHNWMIYDDELGFRLNPENPEINSLSMRNAEITNQKETNAIRIVVLGDSVPFAGNPTLIDILREKFQNNKNIEIINASTPGYTTYQEYIFLKRYITKIEPDIVILAYVLNDNHQFLHKFDENGGMLWTQEAKESLLINNYFDKFVSKSYFLSHLKFLLFKNKIETENNKSEFWWDNSIDLNTAWKDESWIDFDNQIKKMNDILKKQNTKLFVTIFPLETQTDDLLLSKNADYVTKPQREVAYYCDKYEIPFLDLLPSFYKNKESKLYTDGLHLSESGHELTANEIYGFLIKQGIKDH